MSISGIVPVIPYNQLLPTNTQPLQGFLSDLLLFGKLAHPVKRMWMKFVMLKRMKIIGV
jgi:hypothetical protein